MIPQQAIERWNDVDEEIFKYEDVSGYYSRVYSLSKRCVAKVLKAHLYLFRDLPNIDKLTRDGLLEIDDQEKYDRRLSDLFDEHAIHQELYDADVSVPKPEGVFYVPFKNKQERVVTVPGIVSQRLRGVGLHEVPAEFKSLVEEQFEQELEKARQRGLHPDPGDRWQNIIFVEEERKLYLIDFGNWVRR